ncbi:MAG TPA: hypothetical protein VF953_06905 [Terriglobales bacterium]|jgi:hypothetical protein
MKILGLCFLFLSSALVVDAPAQQEGNAPALNTDKAAIQKWLARGEQTRLPRIDSDRVILSPDDRDSSILPLGDLEPTCVYMRTYRVKREARDSDVTRPAGYTTCVPVARFVVKRAVESKAEPAE